MSSRKSQKSCFFILSILWGLSTILITFLSVTSIGQGVFVYLNFPWFWIDFSKPSQSQLWYSGIANTESLFINSTDNVTLGVWHTKPFDTKKTKKNKVLLYLHGNAATRALSIALEKYTFFSSDPYHYHVISLDYRGFGDSTGWPTEKGLLDDAYSVWQWILQNSNLAVTPTDIVVYGHSLGTGVLTQLVHRLADEGTSPGAVILESPFTSIPDVLKSYFPFEILSKPIDELLQHRFSSIDHIQHILSPVLIAHGNLDFTIPYDLAKKLYSKRSSSKHQVTTFVGVPSANHEDLIHHQEYRQALHEFMKQHHHLMN